MPPPPAKKKSFAVQKLVQLGDKMCLVFDLQNIKGLEKKKEEKKHQLLFRISVQEVLPTNDQKLALAISRASAHSCFPYIIC